MGFNKQELNYITIFLVLCVFYILFSYVCDQIIEFSRYDEFQALFVPLLLYPAFHFSRKIYVLSSLIVFGTICIIDFAFMNDAVGAVRTAFIVLVGVAIAQEIIFRNARTQRRLKQEREDLATRLENTLEKVRRLSQILPMCGVCNQLRTDEEAWNKFEGFLKDELDVELIHGVCEKCLHEMMEDISVEQNPDVNSNFPLE